MFYHYNWKNVIVSNFSPTVWIGTWTSRFRMLCDVIAMISLMNSIDFKWINQCIWGVLTKRNAILGKCSTFVIEIFSPAFHRVRYLERVKESQGFYTFARTLLWEWPEHGRWCQQPNLDRIWVDQALHGFFFGKVTLAPSLFHILRFSFPTLVFATSSGLFSDLLDIW